jgi:release factor glutamine methyltransferase
MVREMSFPRPTRLLDMGTGSGVLGISLAKELGGDLSEAVLADRSADALGLARENAEALAVEVRLIESDLFGAIEGTFDLIVANLPYVPEGDRDSLSREVAHDPAAALFAGSDGLDCLRRFAGEVRTLLNPGGLVALEVGHDQAPAVEGLLVQNRLHDVLSRQDLSGIPRFVFARA